MAIYWSKYFELYEKLLTQEGCDQYRMAYMWRAHDFFDEDDHTEFDFENNTVTWKFANQTYDEDQLGHFYSLDIYVDQTAQEFEKMVFKNIDEEFAELLSKEDHKPYLGLLLQYLTQLIEKTEKSSFSYRESLVESLNRIILYIRKKYRPSLSLFQPTHVVEDFGFKPSEQVLRNLYFIVKANNRPFLYECAKSIFNTLKDQRLIHEDSKLTVFRSFFTKPIEEPVIWLGSINQLQYLIHRMIHIGFIEEGQHWQTTVKAFQLPGVELKVVKLQHTKPPKSESKMRSIDIVIDALKGALPRKQSI